LQLLACWTVHPSYIGDHQLSRQLRLLERCLQQFDSEQTLTTGCGWKLSLLTWRRQIAAKLPLIYNYLTVSSGLLTLAQSKLSVMESLPLCQLPSQVVLHRYDLPTLILIAVQSPRLLRRSWRYVTCWANVQPLNGHDLRALGHKPGPQYRQILEYWRQHDGGVISDRAEAETFVSTYILRAYSNSKLSAHSYRPLRLKQ